LGKIEILPFNESLESMALCRILSVVHQLPAPKLVVFESVRFAQLVPDLTKKQHNDRLNITTKGLERYGSCRILLAVYHT
jgi:hypothetical protein